MNYKVQFKSYDPVANATKVSIKQDYPTGYLKNPFQITAWEMKRQPLWMLF